MRTTLDSSEYINIYIYIYIFCAEQKRGGLSMTTMLGRVVSHFALGAQGGMVWVSVCVMDLCDLFLEALNPPPPPTMSFNGTRHKHRSRGVAFECAGYHSSRTFFLTHYPLTVTHVATRSEPLVLWVAVARWLIQEAAGRMILVSHTTKAIVNIHS